ncbi:MAG: PKD domain-containing protein, partial [Cyclobacteriaceae bacterium]
TGTSGITQNFEWAYNNTLLAASVTNPGSNEQRTEFTHKRLVGLLKAEDPNGIATNYEYDPKSRLKLIRDDDQNIVERYRYHYKNDNELITDFSVTGTPIIGSTISLSSTASNESIGTTNYIWDYGDGQIGENVASAVTHAYTQAGSYQIKLSKTNPEFEPQTATKTLTIYGSQSVSVSSSSYSVDICQGGANAIVTLTVSASGGCPGAYNYAWSYKVNPSGSWMTLSGNTSSRTFDGNGVSVGNYQVRCIVTDACGQVISDSKAINYYQSTTNCSGGGF